MPLLKAPPQQRKNVTLQVRIDEDLRGSLIEYRDFLGSSESYVVSEALKLIFEKDRDFKVWRNKRPVIAHDRDAAASDQPMDEIAPPSSRVDRTLSSPVRGAMHSSTGSSARTEPQALNLDFHNP
jgi:hypothetical protein